MTTADKGARADTFPKLMRWHAQVRAGRPAIRHKDRGIWQTWSWAESYETVRALAQGLRDLGLGRGDKLAVAGANRPVSYWSITAAQMLQAVPVPVYADAIADELSYVLENAGAKIVIAQDQEQVDKVLQSAEKLTSLTHILYDEDRGLRDYADPRLLSVEEVLRRGRKALENHARAAALDASIDEGSGDDASIMLYTSGTTGRSKGVVLSAGRSVAAARDTVAFDHLTDRDEAARLSAARLGRRPLPELRARHGGWLLHGLPGERRDRAARPQGNRPELLFRAAAGVRGATDPHHDPDGGRQPSQARAVSSFSRPRQEDGARKSSMAKAFRCSHGCIMRWAKR